MISAPGIEAPAFVDETQTIDSIMQIGVGANGRFLRYTGECEDLT